MMDSIADTQSYMVEGGDRSLGSPSTTSPTKYNIISSNIPQKRPYTSVYNADSLARYSNNARSVDDHGNSNNDINNIDGNTSLPLSDDLGHSSPFTSITDAPYSTISSPFRYPSDIWDDSAMIDQQLEEDQQHLSFISYSDVEGDDEDDSGLTPLDNQRTLDINHHHNQSTRDINLQLDQSNHNNLQGNLVPAQSQHRSSFVDSIHISVVGDSSFGDSVRISDIEGSSFGDSIRISDAEGSSFGDSIRISDIEDSDTENASASPPSSSTKAEQTLDQQQRQQSETNNDLHQVTTDTQLTCESYDGRYGSGIWLDMFDPTGLVFEDDLGGGDGSNHTATYDDVDGQAGLAASDDNTRVLALLDDIGGLDESTANNGREVSDNSDEHGDNNSASALYNVEDFDGSDSIYDFHENDGLHSDNDNNDELNVSDSPPSTATNIIKSGEHISEKASCTKSTTRNNSFGQPSQNYDLDNSKNDSRPPMASSDSGDYSVLGGQLDNSYHFENGCDSIGYDKDDDCVTNLMDTSHRTYTNSGSPQLPQAVSTSPRSNCMTDPSTFHDSNIESSRHQSQDQELEQNQHDPPTSITSTSINEGTKNDTSDHSQQQKRHQTSIDSFYSQLSTGSSLSTAKSFLDSNDPLDDVKSKYASSLPPPSQQQSSSKLSSPSTPSVQPPSSSKLSSPSSPSAQQQSSSESSSPSSPSAQTQSSSKSSSSPAFEDELVLSCSPPRKNPGMASLDQLRMAKIKKRSTSSPKEEEKWLPASGKFSLSSSPPHQQSTPLSLLSNSTKQEQENQLDDKKTDSPPPTTSDRFKYRPRRPILGLPRPKNTSSLATSSSTPSIASMLGHERQTNHANDNTLQLNDTITKSTPPRKKTLGMARPRAIIPK